MLLFRHLNNPRAIAYKEDLQGTVPAEELLGLRYLSILGR